MDEEFLEKDEELEDLTARELLEYLKGLDNLDIPVYCSITLEADIHNQYLGGVVDCGVSYVDGKVEALFLDVLGFEEEE